MLAWYDDFIKTVASPQDENIDEKVKEVCSRLGSKQRRVERWMVMIKKRWVNKAYIKWYEEEKKMFKETLRVLFQVVEWISIDYKID